MEAETSPQRISVFDEYILASDLPQRQKRVLKACLVLFSTKGYSDTTTSDIARLAGVSEGTVYKHFRTKKDLLTALAVPFTDRFLPANAFESVLDRAKNMESVPDFNEFLYQITYDRFLFVSDNREILRVFLRDGIRRTDAFDLARERFVTSLAAALAKVIHLYQARGELIDWPEAVICRFVFGAWMGYILPNVILSEQSFDIEKASHRVALTLSRGLAPQTSVQ